MRMSISSNTSKNRRIGVPLCLQIHGIDIFHSFADALVDGVTPETRMSLVMQEKNRVGSASYGSPGKSVDALALQISQDIEGDEHAGCTMARLISKGDYLFRLDGYNKAGRRQLIFPQVHDTWLIGFCFNHCGEIFKEV